MGSASVMATADPRHKWTFYRRGGLDQVALETALDLERLDQLDPKLWVALACPVKGLEIEERTLALIDTDGDGRIRVPEVLAAVKWAAEQLNSPSDLLHPLAELPLDSISTRGESGRAILAAARKALAQAGTPEAGTITLDALSKPEKLFPAGELNGDGVIPAKAAPDEATRGLIEDIAAAYGTKKGGSGTVGIDEDRTKSFFEELDAFSAWAKKGSGPATAFIGEKTDAAFAAVDAVRAKVNDHFARCRLAALDVCALAAVNRTEDDYITLARNQLSADSPDLAAFPLAHAAPGLPLPLEEGLNPAWAGAIARLRSAAVAPILGPEKTSLTEEEWLDLQGRFGAYQDWLKEKPDAKVGPLSAADAKGILAGGGRAGLEALWAKDRELAPAFTAFTDLERLIRYRRDLLDVLRNFVNFADFYSRKKMAMFEAGFLYLDSRACELCVKVEDPGAHSVIATRSNACVAYCECRRPDKPVLKIAALFTQGDIDQLYVGRNGIFFDRQGGDWDASIVKLIDNPISLRQAFFAPYKKFVRFIEAQFAKQANAAQTAPSGLLGSVASQAGGTAAHSGARKFDVGTIAALGVAVGGISGALGAICGAFFGLKAWMPVGLLAVILAISGPSMLIAWLKLRQRMLGPVLEASGWAINGRVKLTTPLGRMLTTLARLPPHSIRKLHDPYRQRASYGWLALWALLAAVAGAVIFAKIAHRWPFPR